jgi:hypothetical protein
MDMRMARMTGAGALLVLGLLGCNKVSKDHGKVLATVAGEKITEQAFTDTVQNVMGDQAKDLLSNPASKERRNQILGTLVNQKAILAWAKENKLDKDPRAQVEVSSAVANVYFNLMLEKGAASTAEPTDVQLKELYDQILAQATAANQAQGIPPFEQVKAQLPSVWKQRQMQGARERVLKELNEKYPVVFDPEYRPAMMP